MTRGRRTIRAFVVPVVAAALLPMSAKASTPAPATTADGTGVSQSPCFARDNADPKLLSLAVSRSTLDVSHHSGALSFTVRARDRGGPGPMSGVAAVRVRFADRVDRRTGVTLRHLTGDRWTGTIQVGERVRGGVNGVKSVLLEDRAGNAHLFRVRLPFSVVSPSDADAPVLSSVDIAPGTVVDTRRRARQVTVTATAADPGGSGVGGVRVRFYAAGSRAIFGDPIETVLSPTTGGLLSGTVTVPTWADSGTWRVAYAGVFDRAGNTRLYEDDETAQLGSHQSFQVVSGFEATRPRLARVTGMPSAVDVRDHGGSVTLSVRARDAESGVFGVRANLVQLKPDGSESYRTRSLPMQLTRGDRHDGVWTVRLPVRACYFPASGRLKAQVNVSDVARNSGTTATTTTATLSTRPLVGAVVVGSQLEQPYGPPVLAFDKPVVGVNRRSARPFEIDQAGVRHLVTGTWVCATATGRRTSCQTGKVRVAVLRPDAVSTNLGRAYVELNAAGVLDVRDRSGIPFRRAVVWYS